MFQVLCILQMKLLKRNWCWHLDLSLALFYSKSGNWSDFSVSVPAALTIPLWSGEGWNWPVRQCRPGVVPGGAQEPGLLPLHQAPPLHQRRPRPSRLVSSLGSFSVLWVCQLQSEFLCVCVCVSGTLVVSPLQLQLLETNTHTCWSYSVSSTRRLTWRHSQEDSRRMTLRWKNKPACVSFSFYFCTDMSSSGWHVRPVTHRCNAQEPTTSKPLATKNLTFTTLDAIMQRKWMCTLKEKFFLKVVVLSCDSWTCCTNRWNHLQQNHECLKGKREKDQLTWTPAEFLPKLSLIYTKAK